MNGRNVVNRRQSSTQRPFLNQLCGHQIVRGAQHVCQRQIVGWLFDRHDGQVSDTHPTIKFTNFFGTTITFLIVFPARNDCAFSAALAAASSSAAVQLAGTLMTSRSLPLTCTGISSVSSTSKSGLNGGHAV